MKRGIAGRIAAAFIDSKLTPLLVAGALFLGALALLVTPREEEPQIRVPMVDISIAWPGATPAAVAARIVSPIEKAMWGIARVKHVYSTAAEGEALITVRFLVNESNEESLVKVYERLDRVRPLLPRNASAPTVNLYSINDVPFLTLTLHGKGANSAELRPLAEELSHELAEVENVTGRDVIGGEPRIIAVTPDPMKLASAGVTLREIMGALAGGAARLTAGTAVAGNRELLVEAGPTYRSAAEVGATLVAPGPIYLRDIATVEDRPADTTNAVFFQETGRFEPAVTIALAKRASANATTLAEAVLHKVEALSPRLLPSSVEVTVTRNYGETAAAKSRELVEHLLIATFSVVILITLMMGWRSGFVVGIAVPVTLALTLAIYWAAGYTLNRVTLFALIFSIGILVDDAIVVVENIERHHRLGRRSKLRDAVIDAVSEVGNPTILATFTVIAAILPMAFVRGLMGPYMRPIPTGASAAMLFSLAVAFIVSPYAAYRIFRFREPADPPQKRGEGPLDRLYRKVMTNLIHRRSWRLGFFALILGAFAASLALVGFGLVRVKMLPFDNKSEFQVMIDQDEGTPLEETLRTAREVGLELAKDPDVKDIEIYAGSSAPFNFNGLVRHYFLRRSPNLADLQVNLVSKEEREEQSHAIVKRLRPAVDRIAKERKARVKLVEIPPGPPVLDTVVAEIYGPTKAARKQLAAIIEQLFGSTDGVVDIDTSLDAPHERLRLEVDREKSALKGIEPRAAIETLAAAGGGRDVAWLDAPRSRDAVPIRVQMGQSQRASVDSRLEFEVRSRSGKTIPLSMLVTPSRIRAPRRLVRKDLKPVVYVFGDLAGAKESPVYALAEMNRKIDARRLPKELGGGRLSRYSIEPPETNDFPAIKWDGEWQITYEVFRDLGISFAVVLVLIVALVVGWFQSFRIPIVILLPIPLSLVGILPGHLLFGAFFTATSMIGFIAGAGIIVRNSIILVDFIELKIQEGLPLQEAVVEAGVIRFRPMLLTAGAVVVGALVILFDPIFQGLAISLMMGEVAATLLSRMAVPVAYCLLSEQRAKQICMGDKPAAEAPS